MKYLAQHSKVLMHSVILSSMLATMASADNGEDVTVLQVAQEQNALSGFQLAGYASFGYSNTKDVHDGSFDLVNFSPIFHYGYSDILQFEGEVEFSIAADGETEIDMEYAAANLFLNNYMSLTLGKFMSPIGQFRQNFHPSWINKMPDAPVGFGHGGAALSSNVGAALRGGLPKVLGIRHNYVVYVSNAYTLEVAPDGDVDIVAEGSTANNNGTAPTFGGRYAIDPIGGMEIGISGAYGKIADLNSSSNPDKITARDYNVLGADLTYHIGNFDLRGEYVEQNIGESTDPLGIEGGKWQAAYAQVAYQIDMLHLEPVLRYGFYKNPELEQKQTALGLNYLFSNNIIAKMAYEFGNRTSPDEDTGVDTTIKTDKFLAQLAFGF